MPISRLGIGDRWLTSGGGGHRSNGDGKQAMNFVEQLSAVALLVDSFGVLLVIALPQLRRHRHRGKYMDGGDWRELPGPDELQRGSRGGQRRRLD